MVTILAAGSDFVGFLIAVLLLAGLSAAGNRVKAWWAEVTKNLSEKTGSPPSQRGGTSSPSQKRTQQGSGPRPQRTARPTNPPMRRPVIVENLPESRSGPRRGSWQPAPRPKPKGAESGRSGSRPPGGGPARTRAAPTAEPSSAPAKSPSDATQTAASAAQAVLQNAQQAGAAGGAVPSATADVSASVSLKGMTREQLRRIVVLNEILSPPLALREGASFRTWGNSQTSEGS